MIKFDISSLHCCENLPSDPELYQAAEEIGKQGLQGKSLRRTSTLKVECKHIKSE
jgi:hypothetical protein